MSRNVTLRPMSCGCTVDGCGHLPDPVRPVFCALHGAAPRLADALEVLLADHAAQCECPLVEQARAALKTAGRLP